MGFFNRVFNKNKYDNAIDYNKLPAHIAIIMDGNGRWAKKRGLPRSVGHREGSKTLEKITEFCGSIGIKYLTVYGFSTENWS
ncbi:MAG: isoprenyl transferase, partial [Clostridiaceae bacterium]|nr:isoprenyl transferase [Clostridiaceae bacterium]